MLTLTLRATQKHAFSIHQYIYIYTPYIKHELFSPIFSFSNKEYGATPKKETYEALKIAKKMEHMNVPKY
jgi:hypothetical protein